MTGFQSFSEVCKKVEGISSTLEKVDVAASFLRGLEEADLSIVSNFFMGVVFPPDDLILGVGPSILYEAMTRACGCTLYQVQDHLRSTGDPGLVAFAVIQKRKPLNFSAFLESQKLSISEVYQRSWQSPGLQVRRAMTSRLRTSNTFSARPRLWRLSISLGWP